LPATTSFPAQDLAQTVTTADPQQLKIVLSILDWLVHAGKLRFKFFQTLGLVDPHATVFLAPTVKSLLGDAQLLDRLREGLILSLQDFSFT
jgi:hypothetical protein